MLQPDFLKKAYLKKCLSCNVNPAFEIISVLLENKTLNLKNKRISDQNLQPFLEIIKETDYFERLDLSCNNLKNAEKIADILRFSKKVKFLDLRHNFFSWNTLETIRGLCQNRNLTLFLEPQSKNPTPLKNQNVGHSGFLSERIKTESWKSFPKFSKAIKTAVCQSSSNFLMTRMNWLIELKILFEKIQLEQSRTVTVTDLLKIIEEHLKDFVLIEESVYESTHSEIGLSPNDIIDSLRKIKKNNIDYDDIFNLICQISKEPKKNPFGQEIKKAGVLSKENVENFEDNAINAAQGILHGIVKSNSNENVRSSCEHIIETARFNKPEEVDKSIISEKEAPPKTKTPIKPLIFRHENANSPLSFSMSAIQMTDSKTFTLSDFCGDFLNRNFNDSGKHFKSSTSKSSSLTRVMTYESRKSKEEETVIRRRKPIGPKLLITEAERPSEIDKFWKKGLLNFGKEWGLKIERTTKDKWESFASEKLADIRAIKLTQIQGFSTCSFSKPYLTNIRILCMGDNKIESFKEKLDLPGLEFLNLEKNNLGNLSFLGNCKNLRELFVGKNKIKKITNIINLKELHLLDISSNLVESFDDLALLSFNPKLRFLNVRGNALEAKTNFKESFRRLFPEIEETNGYFQKYSKFGVYSDVAFL